MHVFIFSSLNSLVLKQNTTTSHQDVNMYVCQISDDIFVYVSKSIMFTVFSWIMKCTQLERVI